MFIVINTIVKGWKIVLRRKERKRKTSGIKCENIKRSGVSNNPWKVNNGMTCEHD